MSEKKQKKQISNYDLCQRIRKNKARIKVINQQIKDKSISKSKLSTQIENDVEELTLRFKK